ncbi:CAAX amino terminal protease self- immunity [Sphingomonas paucimobilis]|nr:CAAX amino terminal protease self- immunity [Sphingomonas paucimobilis]
MAFAGAGAVTGLGCLLLATGYTGLAGTLIRSQGSMVGPLLALGLSVITVQVAAEEWVFRGWLQPVLLSLIGRRVAVPVVAGIFAGLHLLAGSASGGVALLNLFLGGMLFGLIAAGRLGLAGAFGAHFAWNAASSCCWDSTPIRVSGSLGQSSTSICVAFPCGVDRIRA